MLCSCSLHSLVLESYVKPSTVAGMLKPKRDFPYVCLYAGLPALAYTYHLSLDSR